MFDQISGRFNSLLRDLRGLGKITDKNIADTSREIRRILLEADVNIDVTKDFVKKDTLPYGYYIIKYEDYQDNNMAFAKLICDIGNETEYYREAGLPKQIYDDIIRFFTTDLFSG